jgi:hypothetical protein
VGSGVREWCERAREGGVRRDEESGGREMQYWEERVGEG